MKFVSTIRFIFLFVIFSLIPTTQVASKMSRKIPQLAGTAIFSSIIACLLYQKYTKLSDTTKYTLRLNTAIAGTGIVSVPLYLCLIKSLSRARIPIIPELFIVVSCAAVSILAPVVVRSIFMSPQAQQHFFAPKEMMIYLMVRLLRIMMILRRFFSCTFGLTTGFCLGFPLSNSIWYTVAAAPVVGLTIATTYYCSINKTPYRDKRQEIYCYLNTINHDCTDTTNLICEFAGMASHDLSFLKKDLEPTKKRKMLLSYC